MAKIKVSELFYSIQGEGRFMGVPSVFLRTYGCNFTCDGFGMPRGEKTQERIKIAQEVEKYANYKDLPLVSTGCDSYASWDPAFKHLSPVLATNTIVKSIMDLLPYKKWVHEHLVITGGEPLLGWQRAYPDLLQHPDMINLRELTFETNGTQELTPEFSDYLKTHWRKGWDKLTFSVSPKLNVSGETWANAIKPSVIRQYQDHGYVYLKFVIANDRDADEVRFAEEEYRGAGFSGPVYVMPLGGVESVYSLNNRAVANIAMKNGWRYSDRLQVPLFKNEWGT